MIVVDTNIIAYLYFSGEKTKEAEDVLTKDPEWVAPFLWRSEFRSVIALYLRKKIITLDSAMDIMLRALRQMDDHEYEVLSNKMLTLVNGSNCSAYDCEYVALAKDLKIPLVTLDQKILANFPNVAMTPEEFQP